MLTSVAERRHSIIQCVEERVERFLAFLPGIFALPSLGQLLPCMCSCIGLFLLGGIRDAHRLEVDVDERFELCAL